MSLSAKREYLARIHGRCQRAGRRYQTRLLDEFCATCGYHRKRALRLLNRPLATPETRARPGPQPTCDPAELLPVLKVIWLTSDQLCSQRLKAARPQWLASYQVHFGPVSPKVQQQLQAISPAPIDRLLRPVRIAQPRKGRATTQPGTLLRHQVPTRGGPPDTTQPGVIEVDTVAHGADTTAGNYVNSLTFTERFSGWTENRAVGNKSSHAILAQVKELEAQVPFPRKSFPSDHGSEFLNWPLYEYLTGRPLKVPWTRSRAGRKNDNAHCEQKHWTHGRQRLGYERFEHPELVPLINELYRLWSQYQNHFRPTFKLQGREKQANGRPRKIYEKEPQTPYQRLLESPAISPEVKQRLRAEHAQLDPFALKKSIEQHLKHFFTVLGNLNRESTHT